MEKKKEKAEYYYVDFERWTDGDIVMVKILWWIIWIGVALYILSPIIIAIERYYWIDV